MGLGRTGRMIADALRFLGRRFIISAVPVSWMPRPPVSLTCLCGSCCRRWIFYVLAYLVIRILLGAGEFRLFGNLKILINTSVGPTFRVPDLQRWLSAHKRNFFLCDEVGIGNYADTLTQFDNVIYTPKVSGHSEQCMERLSQKVIANIESYQN